MRFSPSTFTADVAYRAQSAVAFGAVGPPKLCSNICQSWSPVAANDPLAMPRDNAAARGIKLENLSISSSFRFIMHLQSKVHGTVPPACKFGARRLQEA